MWWYVAALIAVTGSVGGWAHVSGGLSWYEGLLVGLLAGVLVIVTIHQRGEHLKTWREFRDIFRRH